MRVQHAKDTKYNEFSLMSESVYYMGYNVTTLGCFISTVVCKRFYLPRSSANGMGLRSEELHNISICINGQNHGNHTFRIYYNYFHVTWKVSTKA